jgi:glycosyltransferase involved in cell wall biosynthesis
MRVLHVVPALFDPVRGLIGGAERFAFELARNMAERVPTTLLSFGAAAWTEEIGRLRIHVARGTWYVRGQRTNPVAPSLLREVVRHDVVHCHQTHVLASSLAAVASRVTGRRVFVTELGGGGLDVSTYISTDRWYHGHLHISEYSRRIFNHADKAWAHVISGGVDAEKFCPDESVSRDGTVVFVGRLLPHKGVDDLIKALPSEMRLEVIGPPLDDQFTRDLQALCERKRVTFRSQCSEAELVAAYRRSLCVVLPSVYRTMYGQESRIPELLGQTLLEGMACGAAAICTDVASMPEIVEHGVTGFVVPPNDPRALCERLRWLRDHPAETRLMGQLGRRRVREKFAWGRVVQRCLEIYEGTNKKSVTSAS